MERFFYFEQFFEYFFCPKSAVKALLEVVQLGGKNLEIAVMSKGQPMRMMVLEEIETYVKEIEEEKEKEAAQKKRERGTTESQP